ncbi:hypothetical protein Vau01_096290 [Virgisporangium aurantiacum]|uniref:S-adenosyl methyltransferase n=2 Tax=Virgisporangium aurantiacum TaxID=175570 RepID=A0A8J4E5I1_9ACTN|nr:hypothetical protein Vau01_096290 [Virgisporangium aurantiacum]
MVSPLSLDDLRELIDIFRHRWDPIILVLLADRPRRRKELTQEVRDGSGEHIADGVLSEVLTRLQTDGMIVKDKSGANHVVYRATQAALTTVARLRRISDLDANGPPLRPRLSWPEPPEESTRMTDNPADSDSPLNTEVPHSARVWNYWLGGKDNFAIDREVGDQVKEAFPDIVPIARESRRFLGRAVQFLAGDIGIRQFLDIGTGLPTADNTHEVAQRISPECRIVYVDHDPLVLAHARALLNSHAAGTTDYLQADVRDVTTILAGATRTLDLSQPIAVMMLGILGNVTDYDEARSVVDRLVEAVSPGSYLVINDGTNVINPEARNEATRISIETGFPYIARSPKQIRAYFHAVDLIEPGVVSCSRWRPDHDATPQEVDAFCGVARKR